MRLLACHQTVVAFESGVGRRDWKVCKSYSMRALALCLHVYLYPTLAMSVFDRVYDYFSAKRRSLWPDVVLVQRKALMPEARRRSDLSWLDLIFSEIGVT